MKPRSSGLALEKTSAPRPSPDHAGDVEHDHPEQCDGAQRVEQMNAVNRG